MTFELKIGWKIINQCGIFFHCQNTAKQSAHGNISGEHFLCIHSHCVNVHAITIAVKKSTFFISSTGKTNMNNFLTAKKHSALIRNAKDTVHEQPLT